MSSVHWLSAFFWRQIVIHLATIGGGDEVTLVTVILGLLVLLRGDQEDRNSTWMPRFLPFILTLSSKREAEAACEEPSVRHRRTIPTRWRY